MAGILLILVVVNAGVTGWLYSTVRRMTRGTRRPPRPRVLVSDYVPDDDCDSDGAQDA